MCIFHTLLGELCWPAQPVLTHHQFPCLSGLSVPGEWESCSGNRADAWLGVCGRCHFFPDGPYLTLDEGPKCHGGSCEGDKGVIWSLWNGKRLNPQRRLILFWQEPTIFPGLLPECRRSLPLAGVCGSRRELSHGRGTSWRSVRTDSRRMERSFNSLFLQPSLLELEALFPGT